MNNRGLSYSLVAGLFILSGIAALIYQVVWFRQLSYFIGSTTYSQSIVLATFMGGLAIGAWYWGKKADGTKNSLKLFAFLEIALAVYCFFYTYVFEFAERIFTSFVISSELASDSSSVLLLKFLVSGITILVPTILMGGTLPVLVKYLSHTIKEVGKNVAILYFMNSLGAVIGTALAGFYLLHQFGLTNTTLIGAGIELFVGLASLLLVYFKRDDIPLNNEIAKNKEISVSSDHFRYALWIAGLSGLCSMIYEVVWLRLLIPVLSSSTYSFTLVLVSFILGITIGSLIIYKISDKIKKPLKLLGILQLGIAASIVLTLPFYERLPYIIWDSIGDPDFDEHSYPYYLFIQFFYVFLVMILPTILMGMTLPLAGRMAVSEINKTGKVIGNIFAINTLGTVIGSLIAGLVLIPFIGIRSTIFLAILLNTILGLTVLFGKGIVPNKIKWILTTSTVILLILFARNLSDNSWAYSLMLSEVPRKINRKIPPDSYTDFIIQSKKHEKLLYYKEGIGGTIVVARNKEEVYLFTNGKGDANSVGDLRTQVSLGQTPVILHPKADSVFVIGFGAGTTIGNVMSHPNVKYGEVAEISSEVIDASTHFNHINKNPLSNKNLRVIKDDGVSALRLSPRKYDIIISQPSNPWSAGVGNLFTKEFFNDCKEKLRPGGFVAQWFSLYEMDDKSLKLILRTAMDQFKHVSLWHIGTNDILLLCSEKEFNFNLNQIEKNYNLAQEDLKMINIHSFSAFLSQQIISSEKGIIKYAGKGPLNTEDHPLLELWAPKAYYNNSSPVQFSKLDERRNFESSNLLLRKYMIESNGLSKDEILQAGLFQSTGGNKELAYYLADLNPEIYLVWSQKASQSGDSKKALEFLERAALKSKSINSSSIHKEKALILGKQGDYKKALSEINLAILDNPGIAELHYQKGTFHMSLNEFNKAIPALEKAIKLDPYFIDAYNNLATIKGQLKDYKSVISLLDKAVIISDKNPKIFFNRAYAKGFSNDFQGAVADFTKALELDPKNGQALVLRGRAYASMGKKNEACLDFSKAHSMGVQGAAESINQFCK